MGPYHTYLSHQLIKESKNMNLGALIDTFKDAIARRVVESYPLLNRPSQTFAQPPSFRRKPAVYGTERPSRGAVQRG